MVTDPDNMCQFGVLNVGLSDHLITYCTHKVKKFQINKHNSVRIRSLKQYSKESFVQVLNEVDWSEVDMCMNVDEAWSKSKVKFLGVLDSLAPFKEVRLKQRTEPWMSHDILDLIRNRDKFLGRFRRTKVQSDYDRYLLYRNQVKHFKVKAKSEYYVNVVNDNKHFNCFFTTIASTLVNMLPAGTGRYGIGFVTDFYQRLNVTENDFHLGNVTYDQVCKILTGMGSSKATGMDELPAQFIKDGASVIAFPVTYMINLSQSSGKVPDDLKLARVVPLYKKKK